MDYRLYVPASFRIRAELKQRLIAEGSEHKKKPWQNTWIEFLNQGILMPDIMTPTIFLEQAWLNNPLTLLPENAALVEQLLGTNFEGQVSALRPFAELFSIALPKSVRFNQQIIDGLFVCYVSPSKKNVYLDRFNADYQTKVTPLNDPLRDPQLTICYPCPGESGYVSLTIDHVSLKYILSAENVEEYSEATRSTFSDETIVFDLSDKERKTQFEILRFVVAFIVYTSAHESSVTFVHNQKMHGSDRDCKKAMIHHVKQFKPLGSVRPHYRNLRDPRFYRGEWKTWAKGSRWVPVNMQTAKVSQ